MRSILFLDGLFAAKPRRTTGTPPPDPDPGQTPGVLSVRVTATNAQGSVSETSTGVPVTEADTTPGPTTGPSSLFSAGQAGLVFLPGTEWTECFVESAAPLNTPCTDGSRVGTIRDNVRNTTTHITNADAQPLYRISGTRHWVEFTGPQNHLPLTGNVDQPAATVDLAMMLHLNGDDTGILVSSGSGDEALPWDTFLGVYQSGSTAGLANAAGVGAVDASFAVNGTPLANATRGGLYTALSAGDVLLEVSSEQVFPATAWQAARYGNGFNGDAFNSQYRLYGLIVRFNTPLSTAEKAARSEALTGQL